MRKGLFYVIAFFCLLGGNSCSNEETVEPVLTLNTSEADLTLGADENDQMFVEFNTNSDWQAHSNVNWAFLNPQKGTAGNGRITVLATEDNLSGEERIGTLTIEAGGLSLEVNFRQEARATLTVEQTSYQLTNDAQTIEIQYSTNIMGQVGFMSSRGETIEWIQQADTKAMMPGVIVLSVSENTSRNERSAQIVLQVTNASGESILESPSITITQAAAPVGTSSSFALDKQVTQLMTHSVGNGVPLVIMGDGFIDADISSGYYREMMRKALEHLFSEEPLHSLQEYFDVWEVTAVSRNNAFGPTYSTALGGQLPTDGSTAISGNHEKVMEYAQAVPQIAADRDLFESLLCIVILNDPMYAGTCYFGFTNIAGGTSHFAIGYCPIINGPDDDLFRRTLVHEGIGHGFTKLLDEYSYSEMGTIPADEVASIRAQQELGWAANVDFTNRTTQVKWARFIADDRYKGPDAWGETLSVYQGACTYWSGVYRPTNESMMRSNMHGFNVPSREAIYKRVMQAAFGPDWAYDYEEFVNFDQAHLPQPTDAASTRAVPANLPKLPAPVFVGQPLRYLR